MLRHRREVVGWHPPILRRGMHAGNCLEWQERRVAKRVDVDCRMAGASKKQASLMPDRHGMKIQGISTRPFPGLVNLVPAVAYQFCLNLPAAFSQPRNGFKRFPVEGDRVTSQRFQCLCRVVPCTGHSDDFCNSLSVLLNIQLSHPVRKVCRVLGESIYSGRLQQPPCFLQKAAG